MNNEQVIENKDTFFIKECLSGNTEIFAKLVEKYKDMVYNLTYRMTGNREDAEDLAQETFLRAYQHLSKFRLDLKFSTWLYTISLNLCRDNIRKKRFRFFSFSNKNIEPISETFNTNNNEIINKENEDKFQNALLTLPEKYRKVLVLKYQQGLSYEEISHILCLPVHTVKIRLHRARNKLRKNICLNRDYYGL